MERDGNTKSKAALLRLTKECFSNDKMSKEAEKAINEAKRRDRPFINLEDWNRDGYYGKHITQKLFECPDNIERKSMSQLTVEQFVQSYLKNKKSVIIQNCTSDWKDKSFWTHDNLTNTFFNQLFKIGEDDDGQKIKVTMKIFMEYLVHNKDDSPLYLFENTNNASQELKSILEHYLIPPYFQEDLLALLDTQHRPLYRWFLMGPQRSGSTVHIDPLMTNAWNTSLLGHKRWVLFSQDTPKYIVKGKQFREKDYSDEAINYFVQILPKIKEKYSRQELGLVEFIQNPGDTVFIPSGVWHAVLNLDDTVAVTQNFISFAHLQEGWKAICSQKPELIPKLQQKLKQYNQQLYNSVLAFNQRKVKSELSQSQKKANHYQKKSSLHSSSQKDVSNQIGLNPIEKPTSRARTLSQSKVGVKKESSKAFSEGSKFPEPLNDL